MEEGLGDGENRGLLKFSHKPQGHFPFLTLNYLHTLYNF